MYIIYMYAHGLLRVREREGSGEEVRAEVKKHVSLSLSLSPSLSRGTVWKDSTSSGV